MGHVGRPCKKLMIALHCSECVLTIMSVETYAPCDMVDALLALSIEDNGSQKPCLGVTKLRTKIQCVKLGPGRHLFMQDFRSRQPSLVVSITTPHSPSNTILLGQ